MNNKRKKTGVPLRAILLYICLCTFVVIGVTFSKYIATSGGDDSARVVKFDNISITEEGDFIPDGEENAGKMIITPGVDIAKKATLDFAGAETASYVFLEVDVLGFEQSEANKKLFGVIEYGENEANASGIPYKINFELDNEWNFLTKENGSYIYYIILEPNTALEDMPIIKDGIVDVSWKTKNSDLKSLGALSVTFKATAVQTDGRSAEAMWELMK